MPIYLKPSITFPLNLPPTKLPLMKKTGPPSSNSQFSPILILTAALDAGGNSYYPDQPGCDYGVDWINARSYSLTGSIHNRILGKYNSGRT